MRDGKDQCAMEIESGMEGLKLPEPQKPKRKWDPDMELTWEHKAVQVLDICREQVARSYPEGCNFVPTTFCDLAKECQAGSSRGVQGIHRDNSSIDEAERLKAREFFEKMMHIAELGLVPKDDGDLSDDDKVEALHLVRCNGFTEYDPKFGWYTRTRFCSFNVAFFDIDEESKVGLGPPIDELTPRELGWLESSINVISLKIIESDLGYPINVFGTVIARDEVDYKCVNLFKRDREDPQLISSSDDVLILTGPNRGLAVSGVMFFEFNLKIRCDDTEDRTVSKGVIEYNTGRYSTTTIIKGFSSWYSTVELVFTRVPSALEASLTITLLKGPTPDFCGRVTAWTTGNKDDRIILFDNEASGTQKSTRGACAAISRVVSVTMDEQLVLCFSAGCNQVELTLGQDLKTCTCNIGSYELLVDVSWTANIRRKNALRVLSHSLLVL